MEYAVQNCNQDLSGLKRLLLQCSLWYDISIVDIYVIVLNIDVLILRKYDKNVQQ